MSRVTKRARVDSAANNPKGAKIRKFDGSCDRTSETVIRTTGSITRITKTIMLPVPNAIRTIQFIAPVIAEISIAAEQVTKSGLLLRERTTATGTGQSDITSPSWIRGQSGPSISRFYQAHCHNATSPFRANQAFISTIWATRTIHEYWRIVSAKSIVEEVKMFISAWKEGSETQAERLPMAALSKASGLCQSLNLGTSLRLGQLVELEQREWNSNFRASAMLSNPPGKDFALAFASTSFNRGQSVRVSPDKEFSLRMML